MSKTTLSLSSPASIDLCLACCGSLPPTASEREALFMTDCCRRPICQQCLASNPRLSRFVPCLACLSGVRAVAHSASQQRATTATPTSRPTDPSFGWQNQRSLASERNSLNIDGSMRDEDVFVLGDEDEDDKSDVDVDEEQTLGVRDGGRGDGRSQDAPTMRSSSPPPAYTESDSLPQASPVQSATTLQYLSTDDAEKSSSNSGNESKPGATVPNKYIIQKSDTLLGIALKYGIDGLTLCKLNNLPPIALRTSPQLLHTRSFLVLPPSVKVLAKTPDLQQSETDGAEDPEWARKRALERAAKRFQLVTKEEDWRIANAYVAIASSSSPDPQPDKEKNELVAGRASSSSLTKRTVHDGRTGESDHNGASASTTARAVDAYLDDDEWEAEQLAAGRRPSSAYLLSSTSRLPSSSKSGQPSTRLGRWTWASRPVGSHEKQA